MNSARLRNTQVVGEEDDLLAAVLRLAAGQASELDRRLVRKHLRRDGEKAFWLIAHSEAEGFPPADPALLKGTELDGDALVKDLRNKVWLALTGLSHGHFGMRIVFDDPGYIEMSPVDPLGFLLLELARAIVRADPSGPQIRTSRCRHCGASIEVKRRHPNGSPVRQYCPGGKCKATANYRARLATKEAP